MPETTTRVIVIRHGETEWNLIHRYQGQLDSPLTSKGRQQADAIGRRLSEESFSTLYSSDLGRALDTAHAIAAHCGDMEIQTNPLLRERDFGVLRGLTRAEGREQFPTEETGYLTGGPEYRIPTGESLKDVYDRCIPAFNQICDKHPGETIVIITHGGVLGMLIRHVLGLTLAQERRYRFFNAAFNEFTFDQGQWLLSTWGDINHLKTIGTDDDLVR